MTSREIKIQSDRIAQYTALDKIRDEAYLALKKVTEDWADNGPCGQGPFTGNTRESRRVSSLEIHFTTTRGGAPAAKMTIEALNIEACSFGSFLVAELKSKIAALNAEMEKI